MMPDSVLLGKTRPNSLYGGYGGCRRQQAVLIRLKRGLAPALDG